MIDRCCSVCDRPARADAPLIRCANPSCGRWLCGRHALTFETATFEDMRIAQFCSRACWRETHYRALPVARQWWIALIAMGGVFVVYWLVVTRFF